MPLIQFSGLASGIDSASLIDAIVESRETSNELRRAEIEFLGTENDALEELNTKVLALNDLVDQFRTINGGGVTKEASTSDATVASAIAGTSAINTSYVMTVTSVATTATGNITNSDVTYSSLSDEFEPGQDADETLTITVGDTLGATITVGIPQSENMTVQEVIDAINADPNADGNLVASAVNTGTEAAPDYQIVLNTLQEGTENGSLSISYTNVSTSSTVVVDTPVDAVATDAVFEISGINGTITRQSNQVSDVISGVTFNLVAAGQTTITVSDDEDATSDAVSEIVTAFNDIVDFVNENDLVERVESGDNAANIFGSLAKTNVDNDIISRFRSELLAATSSNGTTVTSFAEMGISTNRDGTLDFDADDFIEAVGEDSVGAAEVLTDFADNVAGTNGILNQFTKFNGFIDLAQESNNNEISNLNDAIQQLERQTASLRESLTLRFARLEQTTAELQSQESALSGILAGL